MNRSASNCWNWAQLEWVEDCEYYFDLDNTPEAKKVKVVIPQGQEGDEKSWLSNSSHNYQTNEFSTAKQLTLEQKK